MEYKPKIEIKSKYDDGTAFTEIYIDGHKINGVRRFELKQEVGDAFPTLTLDLNALNISTDNEVLLYQFGMGNITGISFDPNPSKDIIFEKAAQMAGVRKNELVKIIARLKRGKPPLE